MSAHSAFVHRIALLSAALAAVAVLVGVAAGLSREDPQQVEATRVLRGSVEAPARRNIPTRVHAFDARRAFLFMPAGRVLQSVDGGQSWQRVRVRSPYGSPRFLTRYHWLASRARRLYETRDGGLTWQFVRVLAEPFRAGHFVTNEFAYTCGRTCALTDDGGRTALRLDLPASRLCQAPDFGARAAAFHDPEDGLAICGGVPGAGQQVKEFWATSDGRRWTLLSEGPGYGYVGRLEPLAGGTFVHHSGRANDQVTEDGGTTWRTALPPESSTVASWLTARIGWALVGREGDVFRTVDGGRHWRHVAPSLWPETTSFCNPRTGFGSGAPNLSGYSPAFTLYATRNGGETWTRRSRLRGIRVRSLFCLSPRDVFAVTDPPKSSAARVIVLRSRDGGRRWTRVRLPADAFPPKVVTAEILFTPGNGATLYATRDAGHTWRRLRPGPYPVVDLAFRSADVGFVLIQREPRGKERVSVQIRFTSDGGRSWRPVPIRIPSWGPTRLFAAGRTFWLLGNRCRIPASSCRPLLLRTSDDGRRWDAIELGSEPPWEARFVSDQVGFQPGVRGLLVTRDGGVTWRWERRGGF